MKKLITVALMTISLYAQDINTTLDAYMSAWNAHDKKRIESFYADDVVWYDLAYDSTLKGKTTVSKAILKAFLVSTPDMYWVKSGDIFNSHDTIIYEWIYGGTSKGERFEIKGISTTTFKDGKIITQKDYYDIK